MQPLVHNVDFNNLNINARWNDPDVSKKKVSQPCVK